MKKGIKVLAIIVLVVLILLGVLIWSIQTNSGQAFLTTQVNTYLRKKLNNKVQIEKLRFDIPDWIVLEGIHLKDEKNETLLEAKHLRVDMDMFDLLQGKVGINKIELDSATAHVYRTLPDTTFNFQFLLDAFVSTEPEPVDPNAKPLEMRLDKIILKKVNLTYEDAVIGTDASTKIDSALVLFDKFNPTLAQYHIQKVILSNSNAKLRLYPALVTSTTAPANPADSLNLKVGNIDIRQFDWEFTDEASGLKNGLTVGSLQGKINHIYLNSQQVDVENVKIDQLDVFAEFAKQNKKTIPTATPADTNALGWSVKVKEIDLLENQIRYDDFNEAPIKKGLDYAHLGIRNLNVALRNFVFSPEHIGGTLESASFKDKSGFSILELNTDFAYGDRETYLKNLYLKTPHTRLKDQLTLKYSHLDQLTNDIGKVKIDLSLKDSQIGFSDILMLVPDLDKTRPFDNSPGGVIKGDVAIQGLVSNMQISKAHLTTLSGTDMNVSGNIQGLPDTDKLNVNLTVANLSSTKTDLLKLLPDSTLPAQVELPESLKITGKINGGLANLTTVTSIQTSFGDGMFSGKLTNITDSLKAQYNGTMSFMDFDFGKLLKQSPDTLGKVTFRADIEGNGYALNTMQAQLSGNIVSASLVGYQYNNLQLNGNLDHGVANISAKMNDANIQVSLTGKSDISQAYPSVKADLNIEKLDLRALNLYQDSLAIKGNLSVDLASSNPNKPLGEIIAKNLVFNHNKSKIPVSDIKITLKDSADMQQAFLESGFMNAKIQGNFQYAELSDVVLTEIGKHFKIPDLTYREVTRPAQFSFNANMINHPVYKIFVPELQELKPVTIQATVDNQKEPSIAAMVSIPLVNYDSIRVEKINLKFETKAEKASFDANLGLLSMSGFRIQHASLTSDLIDNTVDFNFMVRDSVNTNQHGVSGLLAVEDKQYRLNLKENILLDYTRWNTDTGGYITYSPDSLLVRDMSIRKGNQVLSINTISDGKKNPIEIKMENIAIGPMIAIVTRDSTLASGNLNGRMRLFDYMKSPIYIGSVNIDSLAVTNIPLGNFSVKSTNQREDQILVKATLLSDDNDLEVAGNYNTTEKEPLHFKMDLKKMNAKTIEAFSFGELKRASGTLSGQVDITGSTDAPKLKGSVDFNKVSFNANQLGAQYFIDKQSILFDQQRITFPNFTVSDSLNQQMKVTGYVSLAHLPDVGYNLGIQSKNFTVLHSTQKQNDLFYGKAKADASVTVKGIGSSMVIDGKVKLNPGSKVTFVMPNQATDEGNLSQGVIEFVDMKNQTLKDSSEIDKTNAAQTVVRFASEISLDIDVDDKSEFTVVMDELNGDNIKLKGNAQLNTGLAPNGQLFLLGAYDLTEGSYDLTLEILKRKFQIQKGSSLIWSGDPMKAEINITASYTVMIDPGSIVPKYKGDRKIPMEVQIVITGNLTSPAINFQIQPGEGISQQLVNDIKAMTFWADLQNNVSERNKQAFALLITNQFITENSMSGFNLSSNAEAIARQSVSQLLSDQLNNLASDLVKGVNLDVNLNSTADQSAGARTDLNLGLSKAFLNDRLKISVGKNFELESQSTAPSSTQVLDNVALDYSITKDGRYLFRAYRKNQYQSILEGFIIETGVSFIVTADYDLFREIFQKQKNEK